MPKRMQICLEGDGRAKNIPVNEEDGSNVILYYFFRRTDNHGKGTLDDLSRLHCGRRIR